MPCVATAVFGTPEVLHDGVNGYLVPAGDPAALADRITRLLGDPDLRRRMGDAGRDLVRERFMFELQARQYVELFAEMCLSSSSPVFAGEGLGVRVLS